MHWKYELYWKLEIVVTRSRCDEKMLTRAFVVSILLRFFFVVRYKKYEKRGGRKMKEEIIQTISLLFDWKEYVESLNHIEMCWNNERKLQSARCLIQNLYNLYDISQADFFNSWLLKSDVSVAHQWSVFKTDLDWAI